MTTSGSTTTTLYIGALAEYTLIGGGSSWQKYYTFAGQLVADYNGHWHDLLHDQLGTSQVQLSSTGAAESGDLRNPYGNTRYGSSAFMGDLGFTGQRKDSTPNLTYFGARYYDQDVGVFISADTDDAGGLNRYAYVGGNPESKTDPTGHVQVWSWLESAASSVWNRATNPGNLLLDVGTFVMVGLPKTVQYARQYRAIQKAAKGLTNAGRSILAETRFKDQPGKLLQLLGDPEYQSKAYQLGSRATRQADTALNEARLLGGDAAEMSRFAKVGGGILVGVGAFVDGVLTYSDYVSGHADDPNAQVKGIAYGALHAGLSAGLGVAGTALGMAIPIPGVDIVASIAFSAVGSAAGDWIADQVESGIDSGAVATAWSNATNTISGWFGGL